MKENNHINVIQYESHLKHLIPLLQKQQMRLYHLASVLLSLPVRSPEKIHHITSLLFITHLINGKKCKLHSKAYKAFQDLPKDPYSLYP